MARNAEDKGRKPKLFPATNGIEFSSKPPAKKWVIEGVVPEGVTLLYGQSQAGKSFLSLSMAGAIITGQPWLSRFPVQPGAVAYLSLEGNIAPRWHAWQKVNGTIVSDAKKKELKEQFQTADAYYSEHEKESLGLNGYALDTFVQKLDEKCRRLDEDDDINYARALRQQFPIVTRFSVFDVPITLTNPEDRLGLIESIKSELNLFERRDAPPLKLIIVDTISRTMGGYDENTQLGMQTLLNGVEELRRQFQPPPSVLMLHHTPGSDLDKPRGSNSLPSDVDAVLNLKILNSCSPKAQTVPLLLKSMKAREGQSFEELRLTKREISLVDPEEELAVLNEENHIREAADLPLLNALGARMSCIIEETPASDVSVGPGHASPAGRPEKTSKLGKNAQLLVDALRRQPDGRFATELEWQQAAAVASGSIWKAKQEVYTANLVIRENDGVRLREGTQQKTAA